jgi:hypothetical protein
MISTKDVTENSLETNVQVGAFAVASNPGGTTYVDETDMPEIFSRHSIWKNHKCLSCQQRFC